MNWPEFCQAMQDERLRQNLTGKELAKQMGVSTSSVTDKEKVRTGPGIESLKKWTKALGVTAVIQIRAGHVEYALISKDGSVVVEPYTSPIGAEEEVW